jgi:hypothetical protein
LSAPPPPCDPLTLAQQALCNLQNELVLHTQQWLAQGGKPDYTVGGRSFSWNSYRSTLMQAIKDQMELVNMLDNFEIHVRGYPGS